VLHGVGVGGQLAGSPADALGAEAGLQLAVVRQQTGAESM
jgi:hypothetical protein